LKENLEVTAIFDDPEIESAALDATPYDIVTVKDCGFTSEIGEPMIPVKIIYVLLPPDKQVENIAFSIEKSEVLSKRYNIFPAQPPANTYTATKTVAPDPKVYSSLSAYPSKILEYMGTENYRGYKLALIKVHPIQYVPATGSVTFYKSIQLKLDLLPSESQYPHVPSKMPEIDNWVANNVINHEMKSEYEAQPGEIDYLIITREMFIGEAEALKSHKESGGLTVAIASDDNITKYAGRDVAEKIRNCIIDYYENKGIKWVLLMGDVDPETPMEVDKGWEMPTRYMWNPDDYIGDGNYTTTDYYYAGLDGTWDADSDDKFGESKLYSTVDEADWYPEVFVGRITATTTTEMATQIQKIIDFSSEPVTTMLMCGAISDDDTDEKELKEYIKQSFVPKTVTTGGLYESDHTLTETNIIKVINKYQPRVINSASHGSYTGLWLLYGSTYFDTGTPASLTNSPYLWYAMACLAGGFDYEYGDCVGEAMLKDSDGSAIAWVGGTKVTWYYVGYPWHLYGLNGKQDWLFWQEFFKYADYKPGSCLYNSKVTYLGGAPDLTDEVERKNLYAYQLLGDPEILIHGEVVPTVSIYTDKTSYTTGETMHVGLNVTNPGDAKAVSVQIGLEKPDGSSVWFINVPSVTLPAEFDYRNPDFKVFTLPDIPAGTYTWRAILDDPVTGEIICEDTASWEFVSNGAPTEDIFEALEQTPVVIDFGE
jgi:hypothetical protein